MTPIEYALREYGQKEIAGGKHNPHIVKYSTDIGNTWVTTDEVAWCSEFVNWCLLQAGIKGTNSAVAQSFRLWGEATNTPSFGDLVVFSWEDGSGHIGFYVNEAPNNCIRVLGGNQNDEVNVTVFKKTHVASYRKVPRLSLEEQAYTPIISALTRFRDMLIAKR